MHGLDMTESQDSVPGASRAQLEQHGLARGGGDELLFSRENELDRTLGHPGQKNRDRLERIDVELRAESAADRRLDDTDATGIHGEELGELALMQEGNLGVGVRTRFLARIELGDHAGDTHAAMGDVVKLENVLDDGVSLGLTLGEVALRIVENHGGVVERRLVHHQRLTIRSRRDQVLSVQQRRARLHRVFRARDDRQRLVIDLDQPERCIRDIFGLRGDRRDRVSALRTRPLLSGMWSLATPIGRWSGMSAAVMTAWTPGSARAALVSIDLILDLTRARCDKQATSEREPTGGQCSPQASVRAPAPSD